MELIEKFLKDMKEVYTRYNTMENEIVRFNKEYNEKIQDAYTTMIAKDFDEYKKEMQLKYSKIANFDYRNKSNNEYFELKDFAKNNFVINAPRFLKEMAKFLREETGLPFTVKKEVEDYCYDHGSGYADYCDVNVFKLMLGKNEIFRSKIFFEEEKDYLQNIQIFPSDYTSNSFAKFGNISLILPLKQTANIFRFEIKDAGLGFGDNVKSNVKRIDSHIKYRQAILNKVAPDFDYFKLSKFMISYLNQNAVVKENKQENNQ